MNSIQKNCSAYIDCETKKLDRNKIIKKYKSGELPFLVNVRILVEGFDAPITKGICFMHMPSSKTTIIQIIGRALRLHEEKKLANIILPFSSKSDEDNINKFLKVMARNDSRIRKSYIDKKVGGYINIVKDEENLNDEEENNIELRYELIFDKMGILLYRKDIWQKKYNNLKIWIEIYNKIPVPSSKDKDEKRLGQWCNEQRQNYKENKLNREQIDNLQLLNNWNWGLYDIWNKKYENLKFWINENKRIPSQSSKDKNENMYGCWCNSQRQNHKNNILKEEQINKLEELVGWYWCIDKNYEWNENYDKLKIWINENNRYPSNSSNNTEEKYLVHWSQIQRNKKKDNELDNNKIELLEKIKDWHWGIDDIWKKTYIKLTEFIEKYNKIPSQSGDKNEKELGRWCNLQRRTKRENKLDIDRQLMLENLNEWFWIQRNKISWEEQFEDLKKYISDNDCLPTHLNKQLYKWYYNNKYNKYKLTEEQKQKWEEFINDDKYKKYINNKDK
jgi:hypothetical protein